MSGENVHREIPAVQDGLGAEQGWRKSASQSLREPPEGLDWGTLGALANDRLGKGETTELVLSICWLLLRHCIRTLMHRLTLLSGKRDNAFHYQDAERICAMLGYDLAALRAEAAVAIPYAKTWRDLVEETWVNLKAAGLIAASEPAETPADNGSQEPNKRIKKAARS